MTETNAFLLINQKKINCRSNTPLWKVMKENKISISAHLALRSGELITDDQMVNPGDLIELIPVVSGG
jgi:sulfur carrier protein ThiS